MTEPEAVFTTDPLCYGTRLHPARDVVSVSWAAADKSVGGVYVEMTREQARALASDLVHLADMQGGVEVTTVGG